MRHLKAYQILTAKGYTNEEAEQLIDTFNDYSELCTKTDLHNEVNALRSDLNREVSGLREDLQTQGSSFHKELNLQTWRLLGGAAGLGALFKLIEMFVQLPLAQH